MPETRDRSQALPAAFGARTIALVGLMGAGKSTVGRRLAEKLRRPFFDSDTEIEKAAGQSVAEIFATHGEADFRRGERKVIARLLGGPPHVLATGGGAFLDPDTRRLMQEKAVTVWLTADPETLWKRVQKRGTRPLLRREDAREFLLKLAAEREPYYAQADIKIVSRDGPHNHTVSAILLALKTWTPR